MCLGDLRFMPFVKRTPWLPIIASASGGTNLIFPENPQRVGWWIAVHAGQSAVYIQPTDGLEASAIGINNTSSGANAYRLLYTDVGPLVGQSWSSYSPGTHSLSGMEFVAPQWVLDEIQKAGIGGRDR